MLFDFVVEETESSQFSPLTLWNPYPLLLLFS